MENLSFGKTLKLFRERAGLTQQTLGEAIHKDKIMISKFENDICLPNLQDLQKLCSKLQIPQRVLQYPSVATAKIEVATGGKAKSRVNTYQVHFYANKSDFPLLTKRIMKKCGFNGFREVFFEGYKRLCLLNSLMGKIQVNDKPLENWHQFESIMQRSRSGEIQLYKSVKEDGCLLFRFDE